MHYQGERRFPLPALGELPPDGFRRKVGVSDEGKFTALAGAAVEVADEELLADRVTLTVPTFRVPPYCGSPGSYEASSNSWRSEQPERATIATTCGSDLQIATTCGSDLQIATTCGSDLQIAILREPGCCRTSIIGFPACAGRADPAGRRRRR